MNYYFHIASAGERWDTVAYKYYKNPHKIAPIIMSNPHIPISPIIEEGTEIKIPKLDELKSNSKVAQLPIWKQQ